MKHVINYSSFCSLVYSTSQSLDVKSRSSFFLFFSCLLQVFSGSVVGASVVDGDADADGGGEGPAPGAVSGSDDHLYQVIGTLQDEQTSKPAAVSDIVKVRSTTVYTLQV